MKNTITAIIAFTLFQPIYAQNFSKEYGKIAKDEIELKYYGKDKEAEAVVLFDIGKSYFVNSPVSFDVVFERSTRIKIFTESGIGWAEIAIPFYQEGEIFEKVFEIEAMAYNIENGVVISRTPLDLSNTYVETINKFWKVKKFAIPNVKAGSIIEYRYKINSQYIFNFRDWEFQWKIPVIYSEYEVNMIPFYEYRWLLQGAKKFDYQTSYVSTGLPRYHGSLKFQDMVHKYIMKDVPAFKSEEFITSINDYIIKIDFQLAKVIHANGTSNEVMTSWNKLIDDLLKHSDMGKYIKNAQKIAPKLIPSETLTSKSETEKFNIVLNYVKGNYNWNGINGKYATKSIKKFVEEKHGNCADINLFTIGLLNAFGIESHPVIISTRNNGKVKSSYPFISSFNYVVVLAKVDGVSILTDATEILNLNTRIPKRCINDKGLLIEKGKVEWVGLECLFTSEIITAIEMESIKPDFIDSKSTITATEYDALNFRYFYAEKIDKIKADLNSKGYEFIDSTIKVQNQHNIEEPYILTYLQRISTERINEKIYISPFLNEPISDNPLKQRERSYPVDMTYPQKRVFKSTFMIPDGYKADFLPEPLRVNNQLFELNYFIEVVENRVTVSFDYFFKYSVYPSTDYSKLKYYFDEIVRKGNEKIVLARNI